MALKKQADKITIKQIVENCGFSSATFYRHFKDKYDLIAWDHVHRSNEIMNKVGVDDYEWKDTITDGVDFFLKDKEYMQNLLRNTSGHDAFVRYLSEANTEHLIKCIMKVSGREKLDPDTEILARIYCFGTVQTICQWLLGELKCDSDHLAVIYEEALPAPLREILC